MGDRQLHGLLLVGADQPDSRIIPGRIAVDYDQRNGKAFLPLLEFAWFRADCDRGAELDAVQPFQIVLRQDLQTESVSRQFMGQRHQQHFHAALDRIDRFVRRDDDHVPLFGGEARMIGILFRHGEHPFPHILPDVRMVAEDPRYGRRGDPGQLGNFLNFHRRLLEVKKK